MAEIDAYVGVVDDRNYSFHSQLDENKGTRLKWATSWIARLR